MFFVIYKRAILLQSESLDECQAIAASQARACAAMKETTPVYVVEAIREITATLTVSGLDVEPAQDRETP